jgi:predicted ATPase/transcriptional regulator with XRE-family HTH domain
MREKHLNRKILVPNDKLKYERQQRGWTQKVVAERIGLDDPKTFSRWERGIALPSLHYVQKLSVLFDKSPEDLGVIQSIQREATLLPLASPDNVHNESLYIMPHLATPFIGREQEVADIHALLMNSTVRLVTLLGIGGIGKTRLAMQVATRIHDHFSDGVCFVSLVAVKELDQVFQAVASTLAVPNSRELLPFEQVKLFLHEKNFLLVLDNFEQVIEAAPLVEEVINFCPRLKILITSRVALHLGMGNDFVVPPLQLPDLAHLPEPGSLVQYTSVALFVQYAQARLQSFKVMQGNLHAIAELCIHLDGLPLAIELAASHIKLLPPRELLKRLSQRLLILKSDIVTLSERHRTLYNTMKWSYDLLNMQEQWLFRHLSVFVGGASLETIENFFGGRERLASDIVDDVYSLVDKSLLYCKYLDDNTVRVMMLETTRDFGINCLRMSGEFEKVHHSHALYYLHMIEEAVLYLKGPLQGVWLQKIERELFDLREALGWLIDRKETVLALRFCEAFGKFCGLCGYWSEEQRWLQAALELPQTAESKVMRAKVLRRAGHLAYRLRDLTAAYTLYEESVSISRDLEDQQNLAGALSGLAWVLYRQNKVSGAEQHLQESVENARISGDAWTLANALESLGRFMHYQGKTSEASACLEESVTIARSLLDKETAVRILTTLAAMEIAEGNETKATLFAQESLELAQELGTTPLIALALDALGDVSLFRGAYEQAKGYFEESIALARNLGDEPAIASRQLKLVNIALLQEDTQTIQAFVQERLKLFRKSYNIPGMELMLARCLRYIEGEKKTAHLCNGCLARSQEGFCSKQ